MLQNLLIARTVLLRLATCAYVFYAGVALAQNSAPAIFSAAEEIVANYRRMIVLQEAPRSRETSQAGQVLFFRNRELASQLVASLLAPPPADRTQRIGGFIEYVDARTVWRDVDLLALLGVINETRARLPVTDPLARRLAQERDRIVAIRARYNNEITAAFAERQVVQRRRPEWDSYLAFLHAQYPLARVMEELKAQLPAPEERATPSPKGSAAAESAQRDEWTDGNLPPKTILLTFDDGPHPRYTAEILRILDYYRLKAIFFQVGQNLGAVRNGQADVTRNVAVEEAVLRAGHTIANHTYTHPLLPKLNAAQVDDEIDQMQALLVAAAPQGGRAPLFRPPYGARNPLVLAEAADRGLRSVVWNIDSRDWADPIPQSIVQRVLAEATREGRGIVLMHDIHGRTVQALPRIIEGLMQRGFRFAYWEGTGLKADAGAEPHN